MALFILALPSFAEGAQQGPWARPATNLAAPSETFNFGPPSIAVGPDGTVAVAWTKANDTSSRIQVAIRKPGKKFGKPVTVDSGQFNYRPQIVVAPNGTVTVAWLDFVDEFSEFDEIWTYKVATMPAGKSFGTPVNLDQFSSLGYGNLGSKNLALAVGSEGTTVVAWRAGPGGSHIEAAVRPKGGSFSTAASLSTDDPVFSVSEPDVSVASNGTATVVWSKTDANTNETVVQSAIRPAGGSFGSSEDLSQPSIETVDLEVGPQNPQVTNDRDGSTTVVWSRFDGTVNMIQASTRPDGGSFGTPTEISAATPNEGNFDPQIAVGSDGSAVIVWISKRIQHWEVEYQDAWAFAYIPFVVSRKPGGEFVTNRPDFIGEWDRGVDGADPRAVISPQGIVNVIWDQEMRDDRAERTYHVILTTSGPVGAVGSNKTNLTPRTGADATNPELVSGPKGTLTAAWNLDDASGFRVQASSTLPAYCSKATLNQWRGRTDLRKGTAYAIAKVGSAGRLWLEGSPDVKPFSTFVKKPGKVRVPLVPRGDARKQLVRKGYVDLTAQLWFNPKPAKCSLKTKQIRTRTYIGETEKN